MNIYIYICRERDYLGPCFLVTGRISVANVQKPAKPAPFMCVCVCVCVCVRGKQLETPQSQLC